jgi:phosphoribosylformylglycinamidine (FGAM) synthase-like enzyme
LGAGAPGAKAASHGVEIDVQGVAAAPGWRDVATLFGESASRAVVAVSPEHVDQLLAMAASVNLPAARIGVVGGDRIRVSIEGERVLDEPLAASELIWSTAIEEYFERRRAVA